MTKNSEKILLILSDLVFINLAWTLYYYIRIGSGWIENTASTSFLTPLIVVYLFWALFFSFTGLYQYWFVRSRFDEFTSVVKAISLGCFILFFVIFLDDAINDSKAISRFLILIYWALMIISVGAGRILIRSIQMNMLEKGIGLRDTVIIGAGLRGRELKLWIDKFPQLGYKILGFVSSTGREKSSDIMGGISQLPEIVSQKNVSEVLIALEASEKDKLFDILRSVPQPKVHLKILPDTYEIVSGLARTNQLYGVPLIEVMPEIMSHGAKLAKRLIDVIVSLIILILLLPLLFLVAFLIKISSKGPVFYKQVRVGKNGEEFNMYKFRSMYKDAEEYGPEWAGENDPRITWIGRLIRKVYLDEIPQMLNVIRNEMSLVGPRPERPYFVEILKKEIPYYYKRIAIKPGITGWAQIKHKYDESLNDVREKLKYDFYYIENMSLKLDFKIMINTVLVIFFMKGH